MFVGYIRLINYMYVKKLVLEDKHLKIFRSIFEKTNEANYYATIGTFKKSINRAQAKTGSKMSLIGSIDYSIPQFKSAGTDIWKVVN